MFQKILGILKLYYFNLEVPNRLKCVICESVLKNAMQTPCGCRTCKECVQGYLSKGPQPCPGGQFDCTKILTMDDINQDTAIDKCISNITVTCPIECCSFKSTLKNMEDHIPNCRFHKVVCEKCKCNFTLQSKDIHDNKYCSKRIVICKYCKQQSTLQDLNRVHLDCDTKYSCCGYISNIHVILRFFEFDLESLPGRLICVICGRILKEAKQTSCGCRVCEKCIKDYLPCGPRPCPGNDTNCTDHLTINDLHSDNSINKEINKLRVKCLFKSCQFQDSLSNMVDHMEECLFREVECHRCGKKILYFNKKDHDNKLCTKRMKELGYREYRREKVKFKKLVQLFDELRLLQVRLRSL